MPEYESLDGSSTSCCGSWRAYTPLEKRLLILSIVLGIVVFSLALALAVKNSESHQPHTTTTAKPTTAHTTVEPSSTTIASTTTANPTTTPTTVKPSTTTEKSTPSSTTESPSTTTSPATNQTDTSSTTEKSTTISPATTTTTTAANVNLDYIAE